LETYGKLFEEKVGKKKYNDERIRSVTPQKETDILSQAEGRQTYI
jgi:hypothetical protein